MAATLPLATSSAEDTRRAGEALAAVLAAGDVVSLAGDLGAGKTTLAQGVARGLGVDDPVVSPTFTLVRQYQGRLPLYHLDVYRLDRIQDVLDLGFEEMLDQRGVVLIEWGDAIDVLQPESRLEVELSIPTDGDERMIVVSARGPTWARRWERVTEVMAPWSRGEVS